MSSLYQVSNLQPSIFFVTTISIQVDNADFDILDTDYDVYIWDLEAGVHPSRLYNTVQEVSARNFASRHSLLHRRRLDIHVPICQDSRSLSSSTKMYYHWSLLLTSLQTLIKALRICTPQDLYNPAESALRTITRDTASLRARDIKPGEQVDSIWDTVQKGRMSSWLVEDNTRKPTELHEPDLSNFYNKADVLEDAILFPEQTASGTVGGLFNGHETAMQDFMSKGPDWERFIHDLDTDEELDFSDTETGDTLEIGSHDEQAGGKDDKRLVKGMMKRARERDYTCGEDSNSEAGFSDSQITRLVSMTEDEKQDVALMKNWKSPSFQRGDVEKDFYTFLDREKSKGKSNAISKTTP